MLVGEAEFAQAISLFLQPVANEVRSAEGLARSRSDHL